MEQIRRVMRPTDVSGALIDLKRFTVLKEPEFWLCGDLLTSVDPGLRPVVRLAVVRSRQGYHRVE